MARPPWGGWSHHGLCIDSPVLGINVDEPGLLVDHAGGLPAREVETCENKGEDGGDVMGEGARGGRRRDGRQGRTDAVAQRGESALARASWAGARGRGREVPPGGGGGGGRAGSLRGDGHGAQGRGWAQVPTRQCEGSRGSGRVRGGGEEEGGGGAEASEKGVGARWAGPMLDSEGQGLGLQRHQAIGAQHRRRAIRELNISSGMPILAPCKSVLGMDQRLKH
ncbi:hypothetical protein CALVIDRAFT_391414 [Calocera viscosa TUFC12733]|uniref:Uncharacterized protein n=1 Tax=Calocera viscosa (strain TUFC12733) TaxID=1330018 RepID=A0A167GHJ2_CALVF|nr:hypothetical protein CALVIDRAFT_391414 [Calocera viscosa TUFC12733]